MSRVWDDAGSAYTRHVQEHGYPRDGRSAWCLAWLAAMAAADEREATLKRVEAERDLAFAEAEESEGERCRGVMVRREREREAAREVRALTEAVRGARELLAQAREVLRSRGTEPSGERAPIPWNLSNEIEEFLPPLRRLLAVAEPDGRTDA